MLSLAEIALAFMIPEPLSHYHWLVYMSSYFIDHCRQKNDDQTGSRA